MKTTFSDSLRGIEQSDIPWCLDPVLLQRHLPSLNLLYLNKLIFTIKPIITHVLHID